MRESISANHPDTLARLHRAGHYPICRMMQRRWTAINQLLLQLGGAHGDVPAFYSSLRFSSYPEIADLSLISAISTPSD